jgi:hypothetical protein
MTTTTIPNEPRRRLWRSRWAAIGAAVAVTFGGGGLFVANAASSPPSSVVTIDPVRILDTRDPVNVGLPGPFVSAVSQKLQVTGPVPTTTGPQTPVPLGATGVLLNVTVVDPSADGFLSVRPGDATGAPTTSSLNFKAGDIVPNSVQVGLPTAGANAGQIDITYDAFGVAGPTTEVLIDVVGYLAAAGGGGTTVIEFSDPGNFGIPQDQERAIGFVRIAAPSDGKIVVSASASVDAIQIPPPGGASDTTCSITTGRTIVEGQQIFFQTSHVAPLAITQGFPAVADQSYDFSLLCSTDLSDVEVQNLHMTAIFASTP